MPSTTITDISNNSLSLTAGNSVSISNTVYKYGTGSVYFAGSGDNYIKYSSDTTFGFGTGNFSIEMWVYTLAQTNPSNCTTLFEIGTEANGITMRLATSGVNSMYIAGTRYNWVYTRVKPNVWRHVAVSRESGVVKAFVDGVLSLSAYNVSDLGTSRDIIIGNSKNGREYYKGYIDDFHVLKSATRFPTVISSVGGVSANTIGVSGVWYTNGVKSTPAQAAVQANYTGVGNGIIGQVGTTYVSGAPVYNADNAALAANYTGLGNGTIGVNNVWYTNGNRSTPTAAAGQSHLTGQGNGTIGVVGTWYTNGFLSTPSQAAAQSSLTGLGNGTIGVSGTWYTSGSTSSPTQAAAQANLTGQGNGTIGVGGVWYTNGSLSTPTQIASQTSLTGLGNGTIGVSGTWYTSGSVSTPTQAAAQASYTGLGNGIIGVSGVWYTSGSVSTPTQAAAQANITALGNGTIGEIDTWYTNGDPSTPAQVAFQTTFSGLGNGTVGTNDVWYYNGNASSPSQAAAQALALSNKFTGKGNGTIGILNEWYTNGNQSNSDQKADQRALEANLTGLGNGTIGRSLIYYTNGIPNGAEENAQTINFTGLGNGTIGVVGVWYTNGNRSTPTQAAAQSSFTGLGNGTMGVNGTWYSTGSVSTPSQAAAQSSFTGLGNGTIGVNGTWYTDGAVSTPAQAAAQSNFTGQGDGVIGVSGLWYTNGSSSNSAQIAAQTTNFTGLGNGIVGVNNVWYTNGSLSTPDQIAYQTNFTGTGDGTIGILGVEYFSGSSLWYGDRSNYRHTVSKTGTVSQVNLGGGVKAAYFDNTADTFPITLKNNDDFLFREDFTIEGYVKNVASAAGDHSLFVLGGGNGDGPYFALNTNNTTVHTWLNSSYGPSYSTSDVLRRDEWNHIALVRNSSTITLFVNGIGTILTSSNSNVLGFSSPNMSRVGGGISGEGYVTSIRVINGTALYGKNFEPPTTPLTNITNTVLLWQHPFNPIGTNNVAQISPFYNNPLNSEQDSLYATQSNAISLPTSTNFGFGTGNFTIECWVQRTANTPEYGTIFELGNYYDSSELMIRFNAAIGDNLYVNAVNKGNWYDDTTFPINTWKHVAICRLNNTLTVYINGVSVKTVNMTGVDLGSTQTLVIGNSKFNGATPLNGFISNFRVVKGTAVYTSNFIPPTAPLSNISGTVYLLKSPYDQGMLSIQSPFGVGTDSSVKFSFGDRLYVTGSSSFNFSTDFTIEFWINADYSNLNTLDINGTRQIIGFGSNSASTLQLVFAAGVATPSPKISLYTDSYVLLGTIDVANNSWNHVALTRQGSSIKLFVNGVQSGSTYTSNIVFNSGVSSGLTIGSYNNTSTCRFVGYVSNVRIVNGTALYTSNFDTSAPISPLTPLSAIAGTVFLMKDSYDTRSLSGSNYKTPTSPIYKSNVTPFSGENAEDGSLYFSGSDYLTLSNSSEFSFNTGDFTVECWIFPTQWDAANGIYVTGATGGIWLGKNGSNFGITIYNTSENVATNTLPTLSTWTHVAFVRTGTTAKVYYNGTSVATGTISQNLTQSNTYIGTDGSGNTFKGYISNLRVIKGTALYASTFIVPTAPLAKIKNTSLLLKAPYSPLKQNVVTSPFNQLSRESTSLYFNKQTVDNMYDSTLFMVKENTWFNADFTIEFWMYWTGGANTISLISGPTYGAFVLFFDIGSQWGLAGSYIGAMNYFGSSPSKNTWHHIAISRSGTSVVAFLNGEKIYTGTNSFDYRSSLLYFSYPGHNFYGYVSNLRITTRALYTTSDTSITVPTSPLSSVTDTVYLLNEPYDQPGLVSNFSPFTNKSALLNKGRISLPDNSLQITTGPFTLEFWFKPESHGDGSASIVGNMYWSMGGNNGWFLDYDYTGIFRFSFSTGSYNTYSYLESYNISPVSRLLGEWMHVVIGRDNSNNMKCFVNGVSVGFEKYVTTWNPYTTAAVGPISQSFDIGGSPSSNIGGSYTDSYKAYGKFYISNLRLNVGQSLYNSNFTPSTSYLTNTSQGSIKSNVKLLTLQTDPLVDISPVKNTVTKNSATLSDDIPFSEKIMDGSLRFNLTTYYTERMPEMDGDFTIELWFYSFYEGANRFSGHGISYLMQGRVHSQAEMPWALIIDYTSLGNRSVMIYTNNATMAVGSQQYILNAWNHVAICRVGNTLTMYLNGVNVHSRTNTGSWGGYPISIGNNENVEFFNAGYMSNIRIVNGTAMYTSDFTPPTTPLENVPGTVLLIQAPYNTEAKSTYSTKFLLSSISTESYTGYDTVTNSDIQKVGTNVDVTSLSSINAYRFYGSGTDKISIPYQNIQLGTDSFTIELYVYLISKPHPYPSILRTNTSPAGNDITLFAGHANGNPNKYTVSFVGNIVITGNSDIVYNKWTHIAMVKSSSDNIFKLYVDGILEGSSSGYTYDLTFDKNWQMGSEVNGFAINGYISNLRVTKSNLYPSNFTPPSQPLTTIMSGPDISYFNLSTHTLQSLSAYDPVKNTTASFNGIITTSDTPPNLSGSPSFLFSPSSGSMLDMPLNYKDAVFYEGDFTIDLWFKLKNNNSYNPFIMKGLGYNIGWPNDWTLFHVGNALYFTRYSDIQSDLIWTYTPPVNEWTHLALCRFNNQITIYINGSSIGSKIDNVNYYHHPSYNMRHLRFGASVMANAWQYMDGYINNARVIVGKALYTSNFDVPTTASLPISGSAYIQYKESSNTRPTFVSEYPPPLSGFDGTNGSLLFNGTTDHIVLESSNNLVLAGDFTIEFWVKFSSLDSISTIIQGLWGPNNNLAVWGSHSYYPNKISIWNWASYSSTVPFLVQNSTLSLNTWYNVVLTRKENTFRLYVNGNLEGSYTGSINIDQPLRVVGHYIDTAGNHGYPFKGYLSNLRITNGNALYDTSNGLLIDVPTKVPTATTDTQLLLTFGSTAVPHITS